MSLVFPAIAVLFNVLAQIMMERASKFQLLSAGWLTFVFPALVAYGLSMLCYIRTLRDFPVSRIGPIVMVAVLLLLFLYGAITGVKVKPVHIIGAALAITGIVLLSR